MITSEMGGYRNQPAGATLVVAPSEPRSSHNHFEEYIDRPKPHGGRRSFPVDELHELQERGAVAHLVTAALRSAGRVPGLALLPAVSLRRVAVAYSGSRSSRDLRWRRGNVPR